MSDNTKSKVVKVHSTDDLRLALAAGYEASQIEIEHPTNQSAIDAARAEALAEGEKRSAEASVKAERARIAKLQSMARAGFDKELATAIDNGATPEAFALALLEAANDRGITLDAIRKDAPPAADHAAPPKDAPKGSVPNAVHIFESRRKAVSGK